MGGGVLYTEQLYTLLSMSLGNLWLRWQSCDTESVDWWEIGFGFTL